MTIAKWISHNWATSTLSLSTNKEKKSLQNAQNTSSSLRI